MSGHQYVPNPSNLFADEDEIDDELFLRNARRTAGGSATTSPPATDQGYHQYDQFQKNFLAQSYDPADEEKYGSGSLVSGKSALSGSAAGTNFTRPDVLGPEPYQGGGAGDYGVYGGQMAAGYGVDPYATAATSPYGGSQGFHSVPGRGGGVYGELDSETDDEIVRQRQTFEQRRRELEESTLLTSQRCLGVLRETEQVGIATAEELHRQREQLEKTKKQLDEINNSLRFSQKHLNSLKSDFRIPDNYWPDAATRMRQDYHHQAQDMAHTNGAVQGGPGFSHQLDQNLDDMRGNLSRLKNLALDLNQEIDSQNDLIDDISNRVEDVDVKIGKQNKDMNRLMRK
ncbi:synaptosomal-associated protein 29 [Culex quinquefasciatus]|uniref:Synaptosomal-associated protein 29 n=1 Tax=Culex quinquefasciatus TaxID=7176 RepID=B0WW80_CULQU|nr:synaptosomal-associated protein 29 [Culex quinquefasciatus]|eukprot:XP_001861652.1 synaptosomal-associated protein 29 [Culex quinquefasciatus]